MASKFQRKYTVGRLIWDTLLSAKELIKIENYELNNLVKFLLNESREDYNIVSIDVILKSSEKMLETIIRNTKDALYIIKILLRLSIVPLSKQLANISGNLWQSSLRFAYQQNCEMRLLHEYSRHGYIWPDPYNANKESLNLAKKIMGTQNHTKESSYEGGLVLDPKTGFYDSIVLLLDFTSMYPSVIQEFNICFTTVDRKPSLDFNGDLIFNGEENEVDLPATSIFEKKAILPQICFKLVEQRKSIKHELRK